MAATQQAPEENLYSIFDDMSDGVMILDPGGNLLYRNRALNDFPEHLQERVVAYCDPKGCDCRIQSIEALTDACQLEGWTVSCHPFGINSALLIKYDDSLGERIKNIRSDFAQEIANGSTPALSAMNALRNQLPNRWIAIGNLERELERVTFDLCFDGDALRKNRLAPLYRAGEFRFCKQIAVTNNLRDLFEKVEPLVELGIEHAIGLSLKNHHGDCVGYALVCDDTPPDNVKDVVTLLQELSVLYGPYFEAGTARNEATKAVAEANTDIVTGFGNRRAFETCVQEYLADMRYEIEEGGDLVMFDPNAMRNSSIMLVDFDAFKRINDVMGHEEGDRALRCVATALSKLRDNNHVFRIGGDELVQVFPRSGNLDSDDLRQHVSIIEREMEAEGFEMLGLSIGVVHFFEGDGSLASLMALADARMYQDKRMRSIAFV